MPSTRHVMDRIFADMERRAADAVAVTINAPIASYDRRRHLTRLFPRITEEELGGPAERIIARLEAAIEVQREHSRRQHWCFDMNRLIALKQALAAEQAIAEREAEAA